MRAFLKHFFLFLVGGTIYFFIEVIFRGYSHPSMFICGGLCFLLIGLLDETKKVKLSLTAQMLLGSIIITALELITGLIVNVWLKMNVWDYSSRGLNFMGQICLLYTIIWYFLSFAAIILDDLLRYRFFNQKLPSYKIFERFRI